MPAAAPGLCEGVHERPQVVDERVRHAVPQEHSRSIPALVHEDFAVKQERRIPPLAQERKAVVGAGHPPPLVAGDTCEMVDACRQRLAGLRLPPPAMLLGLALPTIVLTRKSTTMAFERGLDAVQTLDVIVGTALANEPALLAVWRDIRRNDSRRKTAATTTRASIVS